MKLEKRSSGEAAPTASDVGKAPQGGNKPVVVYIMILFIAAFLLMALSFLMHQRSNTQALGELQSSVSAMQEFQASQEKIIQLQDELAQAEKELDQLKEDYARDLQSANEQKEAYLDITAALTDLYCLQQSYSAKDYEGCGEIIDRMEKMGYPLLLSQEAPREGVTPPHERYQQLKDAVESKLAEQGG